MRAWLSEPITRAEAIGWVLTIPALLQVGLMGYITVWSMRSFTWSTHAFPDAAPPLLGVYERVGERGILAIVALCAAMPIVTLFTRQRPWVRLLAPVICALLMTSLWWHYSDALMQYMRNVSVLHGSEAGAALPR